MTPVAGRAGVRQDGWPPMLDEVDLDVAPEVLPPRRRPLLAAAAVVAVVALVGAAAARSAFTTQPAPPKPAVNAWVSVRDVLPDSGEGRPALDLVVTVSNQSDRDLTLGEVIVGGPRAGGAAPAPGVKLVPAGQQVSLLVRQPLSCTGPLPTGRRDAGLDVRVSLGLADDVPAVTVGGLAEPDGACAAVAAAAPDGLRTPVTVTASRFEADGAHLTVGGLPAGGTPVTVHADGWLVPLQGSRSGPDGTLRLDLAPPSPHCADLGSRGVVPFGLQLGVATGTGLQSLYAPVGPDLARWLVAARDRACPAT